MRNVLIEAIKSNQAAFGLDLHAAKIKRLADYYELLQEYNPLLHLVAPCSPEEFAVRHILEPLILLEYLPKNARFADIGTGAGLPAIPCLLSRGDISALLIESKQKKAAFLENAVQEFGISERADIINRQFEEIIEKDFSIITSRALDRFTEKLPKLLKWSGKRPLLLFGGPTLGFALNAAKRSFEKSLLPFSNQRYLFSVNAA